MGEARAEWRPTQIIRAIEHFRTGSRVIRVETDQGEGFLKALGVDNGPHVLACELVGTLLAHWLGLRTFDFALIDVPGDLDLRFADDKPVVAGPGFITRAEEGAPWSGDKGELEECDNSNDIHGLVIFDTWTMNCDRYRPPNGANVRDNKGNVFRSEEGASAGNFVLKAIDHGCCFTCEGELTVSRLQRTVNDDRLYGRFPAFAPYIEYEGFLPFVAKVETILPATVEAMIGRVPAEWAVEFSVRKEWCQWICERSKRVRRIVEQKCPRTKITDPVPPEGQTP